MSAPALPLAGGRGAVAKATSNDLKLALRTKFGGKGYQVFFEVGNDTGTRATRHADAVSIGIWPSTGHAIHGFEIKISRGDWLRELADPSKSQEIFRFCHRWSLVTPAGLVAADELPPGWGHYAFKDGRLREAVMPKRMEPQPPTAGFMAALVRCAGGLDESLISEAVGKERRAWEEQRDAEVQRLVERRLREHGADKSRAVEQLTNLEKGLGEPLSHAWDIETIGQAIKHVRRAGVLGTYAGLNGILRQLRLAETGIAAALAEAGYDVQEAAE